MQCKPVTALPAGEKWTFEIKLDGYRCIAVKRTGKSRYSRATRRCSIGASRCSGAFASLEVTSFSTVNWSLWILKNDLLPAAAKQYFTGASDILLRIRFTEQKWQTAREFTSFRPPRNA